MNCNFRRKLNHCLAGGNNPSWNASGTVGGGATAVSEVSSYAERTEKYGFITVSLVHRHTRDPMKGERAYYSRAVIQDSLSLTYLIVSRS